VVRREERRTEELSNLLAREKGIDNFTARKKATHLVKEGFIPKKGEQRVWKQGGMRSGLREGDSKKGLILRGMAQVLITLKR